MAAPNTPQGTLNRLRASVVWTSVAQLNVTPSYLGKAGISLSFEGEFTTFIDTMTGGVTSSEPYVRVMVGINLLKTQSLANLYKQQMELNTVLGNCTIRPDVTTMDPWIIQNVGIAGVRELSFAGLDPGFMISLRGYYQINSQQWSS